MTAALCLALACGMVAVLWKARREYLRLPELQVRQAADLSDITVIIPARNEEANIAASVSSLSSQARVIVVDDASTDGTAAVAREAGAEVISAPPLKKHMAGKANACAAGAKAASSTWILFVDADTRYAPEFLPSLLAEARANSLDLVSVYLKQEYASLWEATVLPYAIALSFAGVNARKVNEKKSFDALGSGSCMLFRRDVYEFLGGHTAVSTSIIEDAMLAYTAKRHRVNQKVMRAEQLGSIRRGDGLRGVWRWLERSSFRFVLVSRWCAVEVLIAALLLSSYLPVIAVLLWEQRLVFAGAVAIIPPVALAPWYGGLHRSLLAPYAIYAFDAVGLLALIGTALGKGPLWKGRRAG